MKKLLPLLCLLLIGLKCQAQTPTSGLPTDSVTQKVTYQGVIQVPGASQAELYSRAREWFATSFGSAKAVLEMDDAASGKLIGNTNSRYVEKYVGVGNNMVLWKTINVQVKDGRFRYAISNFAIAISPATQTSAIELEKFLKPAAFGKDGKPNKYIVQKIEAVKQTSEAQVASLLAAMTKPAAKSDW